MRFDNKRLSNRYTKYYRVIVLTILFLFLSSSVTLGVRTSYTNRQLLWPIQQNILTRQKSVSEQTIIGYNSLISNNTGNDFHPRMTTNHLGHTIIVYEREFNKSSKKIPVVYSDNDGYTWTIKFLVDSKDIIGETSSGILQYPDIVYNALNDLLYLTMIDPDAEIYNNEMGFIQGDIANASEASWYGVSGSTGYFYGACACTNNFFLALSTEDTYGLLQTLCLGYFTYPDFEPPPVIGGFYYDGNSLFQSAPAAQLEMDSNANQLFSVFETKLDSGTKISIKTNVMNENLITSGKQYHLMEKYADPEVMPSEYLGFGTDPDVSGSGNKVCVVYKENGNIICKSSSTSAVYDPKFDWHVSTVELNASAPAVYMEGNIVYCAYVKHGNLYLRVSENSGMTWSAAEQKNDVNGTVVGEKGTVDIGKSGVAFTDTRNGNYDIYFSSYEPRPTPCLVITDLSTMKMKIKNVGYIAARNVSWNIIINGDFIILGRSSSGMILGTLEPDQEITVGKKELLLGLGHTEITATTWADNAPEVSKNINGVLLLFFFFHW